MLPPSYRLKRLSSFAYLRKHARPVHHPFFLLLVAVNKEEVSQGEPATKFGFAASRRVGSAVKRTRAKRQLRGAVYHHLSEIAPGWLCLFVIRGAITTATSADIETAVRQSLRKAKLLGSTVTPHNNDRDIL